MQRHFYIPVCGIQPPAADPCVPSLKSSVLQASSNESNKCTVSAPKLCVPDCTFCHLHTAHGITAYSVTHINLLSHSTLHHYFFLFLNFVLLWTTWSTTKWNSMLGIILPDHWIFYEIVRILQLCRLFKAQKL